MDSSVKNSKSSLRTALSKTPVSLAIVAGLSIAPASLANPGDVINDYFWFTSRDPAIPEVAMDDDGDFIVAGRVSRDVSRYDGYNYFYLYDKAGKPVSSGNVSTSGNTACQSVAMDADGDFVIAWSDFRYGGPYTTYFQVFDKVGNLASPEGTMQSGRFGCPKVAMDDDGDFVIALNSYSGYGYYGRGLYAQTFYGPASGAPGKPKSGFIQITDARVENFPFGNHAVAIDADGDFVIAFVQSASGYAPDFPYTARGLNYVRLDPNAKPIDYAYLGGTAYTAPDVAMDKDGDFVVVATDAFDVYAWTFDYKGNPGISGKRVAQNDPPYYSYAWWRSEEVPASVSMDADGDFNVTEIQYTKYNEYLYINRFDASGSYIGQSYTYATFPGYKAPSIAMDADGDFVVAGYDYYNYDVVTTTFEGPDPVVDLVPGVLPSATTVVPGNVLTYNVIVANKSSDITSDATTGVRATFNQTLGSALQFVSVTAGAGWSCPAIPTFTMPFTCVYSPPLLPVPKPGSTTTPLSVGVKTALLPDPHNVSMDITATSNYANETLGSNLKTINTLVKTSDLDLELTYFTDDRTQAFTTIDQLVYRALVTNKAGVEEATGVTISMPIETGLAYNSATGTNWGCDDTTVAGTVTCVYTQILPAVNAVTPELNIIMDTVSAADVSSVATVAASSGDINTANNSLTDVTTSVIDKAVNLAVTIDDGKVSAGNGSTLAYTANVSNSSSNNISATGTTLSVTLDPGLTFVSADGGANWNCGVAAPIVCTYVPALSTTASAPPVTIVATAPITASTVTTNATVSNATVGETEEDASDNTAADSTTIFKDTVDLSITSSSPTAVKDGGAVTYVLSATNALATATGVSIQTELDSNLTLVSASGVGLEWTCSGTTTVTCNYDSALLAAGSTTDLTIIANETGAATVGATLTTISTVSSSDQFETNATDNSKTDNTNVVAAFVDLSLTLTDNLTQAFTGATLPYDVVVTNTDAAADPVTNVKVTVDLPAGATFINNDNTNTAAWDCLNLGLNTVECNYIGAGLAAGGGASAFTLNVTAPLTASLITTSAVLSTTQNDASTGDNTAVDNDTNVFENKVDLSVLFSDGLSIAQQSDNMMYVASVTNNDVNGINGTDITLVVDLDDTLTFQAASSFDFTSCDTAADANNVVTCTYTAGNLAMGETISAYFFVQAPATATALSSTATATETPLGDLNSLNNTDIEDTTSVISNVVDLTLEMTGGSTAIVVGARETYTATVTNNVTLGDDASGVTIDFNLSDQLPYDSSFGTNWTCSELIGIVTCTYSLPLAPSETTTPVTVNSTALNTYLGTVTTSALASASLPDTNATDNTVSINNDIVSAHLDMEINLVDGEDFVAVNQPMTYVATVSNKVDSLFDAEFIVVTFDLDVSLTYIGVSSADWTCVETSPTVKCNYAGPALSPGAASSVVINVTSPSIEGKISSSATVEAKNVKDNNIDNDTSSEGTVITVANTGASLDWLTALFMMMMAVLRKYSNQTHRER